ncbi:MAG TPA: TadE/TadG family type IV pilus assembly protein [Thermohalobaculum sp.]|nr:TadE/TadG family type IV pilus assembly protein [Thermohalobaculum sp.]
MESIVSLRARLGVFGRDCSGNATLEFVIIFPFLMFMILSIAEAGILMTRVAMLDRGVDIANRDLRLGLTPGITHDGLKTKICEAAFLLGGCNDAVLLELTPLATVAGFPTGGANCIDRTSEVEPAVSFTPGVPSEIMLVRACVIVEPMFPGMGLGAMLPVDASGGYAIIVQSAFMNEPG